MIFEVKEQNGGMYATVSGRLDTPAAVTAQQEINPLLENGDKEITLDCTNLEYISSSGLRLLLAIRKKAAADGGKVIIEHINDDIKKVFMMTGFYNLFEIR
ncbi:MAG: STAS domain-containing protein [Prevotella sp.]|nr:STAS domain-containing protein [Prevotella sp.]